MDSYILEMESFRKTYEDCLASLYGIGHPGIKRPNDAVAEAAGKLEFAIRSTMIRSIIHNAGLGEHEQIIVDDYNFSASTKFYPNDNVVGSHQQHIENDQRFSRISIEHAPEFIERWQMYNNLFEDFE